MLKMNDYFLRISIPIIAIIGITNFDPAIATAPAPPELVHEQLKGKTVHILYVTNSDKVLVRCYPGLQPKITVVAQKDGTKEGTLICK
jgi:hypothetical protein